MLSLGRKIGEVTLIRTSDGDIAVKVLSVRGNTVRLGFVAPESVAIIRPEAVLQIRPATNGEGVAIES